MHNPLSITTKDIADFILRQPNERKFDMSGNNVKSECGCIMVQYGLEINLNFNSCGTATWETEIGGVAARMPRSIFGLVGRFDTGTYGELKEEAAKW